MYIWNETLKSELLKEMQRISKGYRPDGLHWMTNSAEKYHKLMYDTLSLMGEFPLAIKIDSESN